MTPSDFRFSRRTVLRTALAAAGATALGLPATEASAAPTPTGVSVYAFPLSAVTLLAGPFKDNMTRTTNYLSFVDPDRLLHTFRLNVGLPSSAQPCGGWETPDTELRGHSTGHLMSALAQAYANTGNTAYKTKGDYLVSSLASCQAAAPNAGYHSGYLSAFPENFFDRLESGQQVWAPYYTIHKIMAGLLDQYLLAGNSQALTVVTAMASWVKTRTDPLSYNQMQAVLGTEFGGMPEVLTNLYFVTGNADQLTTAQRFDHAQIENPLAADQDQLNGFHANTQIPKIIGAIREYQATGTTRYRDIAANFWDIVTGHHTYSIGGNSNGEYFHAPDAIASQLSSSTCECCNTYNMLKLTRQLFFTNPTRADYLDYYERALFNQILGQQDPNSSHGFVAYYLPLQPGAYKDYSNDYDNFTCDHGTGMESNTKYADTIWFYSGETLYLNLFIASVLTWPGRGITVRQDTSFPTAWTSRLTVTGSGHIALKVRIPAWTQGATVAVNGTPVAGTVTPGSYLTIDRTWASGDTVDVTLKPALAFAPTPDNAGVQSVEYGPIVLAGEYGSTNLNGSMPSLTAASVTATGTALNFSAQASTGSVNLKPLYQTHHEYYNVYWQVSGAAQGTSYEAEASGNTLAGQASVRSSSGASGGALVGYVGGGSGNYLQFNDVAGTAGSHRVVIWYASGEDRSLTLSVNGGSAVSVSTPSTGGWDTVGSVTVTLALTAGGNTVRIGNASSWAPDIDRIVAS